MYLNVNINQLSGSIPFQMGWLPIWIEIVPANWLISKHKYLQAGRSPKEN